MGSLTVTWPPQSLREQVERLGYEMKEEPERGPTYTVHITATNA